MATPDYMLTVTAFKMAAGGSRGAATAAPENCEDWLLAIERDLQENLRELIHSPARTGTTSHVTVTDQW